MRVNRPLFTPSELLALSNAIGYWMAASTLMRRTPFRFSDADGDEPPSATSPLLSATSASSPLLSSPSLDAVAVLEALQCRALQPFDETNARHLLTLEVRARDST